MKTLSIYHIMSPKPDRRCHAGSSRPILPLCSSYGYDAAIKETGRLTVRKVEMDEEALHILNMKFQILVDSMDVRPEVTFTYFEPDKHKAGGAYVEVTGMVKR
jgi:hypothetical protein